MATAYARVAVAVVVGALAIPLATAIVPPVNGRAAIVCLARGAPDGATEDVIAALQPADWRPPNHSPINGLGSTYLADRRHVALIEFDRYASDDERAQVVAKARALPGVVAVVEVAASPQTAEGSDADVCP